jgi:hypothetical protein
MDIVFPKNKEISKIVKIRKSEFLKYNKDYSKFQKKLLNLLKESKIKNN